MRTGEYGRTGKRVTVVGFGGMRFNGFPYRWAGVEAAVRSGCGVVVINPLGGGMIPTHEDALSFFASENETPTEAALRFVISRPEITVALVGFSSKEHVDAACNVAGRGD